MKSFTLRPTDGGRLVNARSIENVGEGNYLRKVNWRRVSIDAEGLREGELPFDGAELGVTGPQLIVEAVRPNGDRSIVVATATTIYRYNGTAWSTIGSGFSSAGVWDYDEVNGWLVLNNAIDLPVTFRHEDTAVKPIYELREMGVARVGVIVVYNGILKCWDVTEIQASSMATWMNGATPYGVVPDNICNRIRYLSVCSEINQPRRWAPRVTATMTAAGSAATLAYPLHSETLAAATKIAIIGAGPAGGVLGGQEGVEDGCPVATLNGTSIAWTGASSDAALTYPLTVTIMRYADISTIVSRQDLQDDSSAVLAAVRLGEYEMIYRETGIFVGRYTGSVETPFIYRKVYSGPNVPPARFRRCIATVDGAHVYPSDKSFFSFDGSGAPEIMLAMDDAKAPFFQATGAGAFAAQNPITGEVWWCHSGGVLAYDTIYRTVSEIDRVYTAVGYVVRPSYSYRIVLVAAAGEGIKKYGATTEGGPLTYLRSGQSYTCRLLGGLASLGDVFNLKDLRSYLPQLSARALSPVRVKLWATRDPEVPATLEVDVTIASTSEPDVLVLMRDVFFQDELLITSPSATSPQVRLTARTFEVAGKRTRGMGRLNE